MSDPWMDAHNKANGGGARWFFVMFAIMCSLGLVALGIVLVVKSTSSTSTVAPTKLSRGLIDDAVLSPTALPPGASAPNLTDTSNALPPKTADALSPTAKPHGWPSIALLAGTSSGTGSSSAASSTTSDKPHGWPTPLPGQPASSTTPQPPNTPAPSPSTPQTPSPLTPPAPGDKRLTSIAYGTDPVQTMDVYWRSDIKDAPIVYLLHGGNEDVADKSRLRERALMYQEQGLVVVTPNFRYAAAEGSHPLSASDAACGLAVFARRAATYGADAQQIVVHGYSYGAHLGSYFVYDSAYPWFRGCSVSGISGKIIGFAGESGTYGDAMPASVRDGAANTSDPVRRQTLLAPYDTYADDAYVMDGAINYLTGGQVPAVIIHGKQDSVYATKRATDFAAALKAAHIPVNITVTSATSHDVGLATTPALVSSLMSTIQTLFY